MIYDKRGIGKSGGAYESHRPYEDLANDALSAIAFLKQRREIAPSQIGIWGLSQLFLSHYDYERFADLMLGPFESASALVGYANANVIQFAIQEAAYKPGDFNPHVRRKPVTMQKVGISFLTNNWTNNWTCSRWLRAARVPRARSGT